MIATTRPLPRPHCRQGTSVTKYEGAVIQAYYSGVDVIGWTDGDLRTVVDDKGCLFLTDSGCMISSKPYYPATCRAET